MFEQALSEEQKAERQRQYEAHIEKEAEDKRAEYLTFKTFLGLVCAELSLMDGLAWTPHEREREEGTPENWVPWNTWVTLVRADEVSLDASWSFKTGRTEFSVTVPKPFLTHFWRARRDDERRSMSVSLMRKSAHVARAVHKTLVPVAIRMLAEVQKTDDADVKASEEIVRVADELVGAAPDRLEVKSFGHYGNDDPHARRVRFSGSDYSGLQVELVVHCYPGHEHPAIKIELEDVPARLARDVLALVSAWPKGQT